VKEIRNKTTRPIRVALPGGKSLHLGPAKVAQIADNAITHAAVKKLIEAGTIEIVGEGERAESGGPSSSTPGPSQGPAKQTFRRGSGER
jgi:ribosomal protein L19E